MVELDIWHPADQRLVFCCQSFQVRSVEGSGAWGCMGCTQMMRDHAFDNSWLPMITPRLHALIRERFNIGNTFMTYLQLC